MPIPAFRTKQTTSTTGTGTLTLNAASAEFRSLTTAFGGASVKVRYILSRSGVYEVGYGTFNGSNQLTRDTVIASSNGGSLVSLSAGDTDVFFDFLPGDRQHYQVTGTGTLALADLGNFVRCTPSADMTLNLPAVATVPPGMGYLVRNDGTNNAVVYIDPNGAEGLDAITTPFPLFRDECVEFFSVGSAWRFGARPTGWRFVGRSSASSSASVDFVLPQWINVPRSLYRVEFRQVRPATDAVSLIMRVDDAGGASFDAGASDYSTSNIYVSGVASVTGFASAGQAYIGLSTDMDSGVAGNNATGVVTINPGAAGARFPTVYGTTIVTGNGGSYAGPQLTLCSGQRLAAIDANAIRFLMTTGNIALGDFSLFAMFD